MERFNRKFWLVCCTALLLSACNDSDNHSNNAGGTLQQFSNNSGDSKEIMDPDGLQQDLSNLLGNANADPVAVNAQDNVQAIINRANTR